MARRPTYLPQALQALAAWYANFYLQFEMIAAEFGLDPAAVKEDNNMVQYLAQADTAYKANIDGFRGFRDETLYGDIDGTTATLPAPNLPPAPAAVPIGIVERLVKIVDQIKAANAYTEEIGNQLGIIPPEIDRPAEEMPIIKAEAVPDSKVSVRFTRNHTDGVAIETKFAKSEDWKKHGNFGKSPAVLDIERNADNSPQLVQVRARFLDGNTAVGSSSPIIEVITMP